jgi:hypothetical protein
LSRWTHPRSRATRADPRSAREGLIRRRGAAARPAPPPIRAGGRW